MRDLRCVFGSNSGFNSSYSISFKASYRFCTLNVVIISFVSELWEREFWKAETGFLTGNPGTLKAVFLKIITLVTVPRCPKSGSSKLGPENLPLHKAPRWFLSPLKALESLLRGSLRPAGLHEAPGYVGKLCCVHICAFL